MTLIHAISFQKPRHMKQQSSSHRSKTNYRRPRRLADKDIHVSPEHPKTDLKEIARGIVRRGLKVAGPKELVSLRIDADVESMRSFAHTRMPLPANNRWRGP